MARKTKKLPPRLLFLILATILLLGIIAITPKTFSKLPFVDKLEQRKIEKWQLTASTYKTTWEYTTGSGRQDKINFTLTLEQDLIKDVSVEVLTASKDSQQYQSNFAKALPKLVIGKKLSDIASLDTVSGASGTTRNFKEAVAALETQLN